MDESKSTRQRRQCSSKPPLLVLSQGCGPSLNHVSQTTLDLNPPTPTAQQITTSRAPTPSLSLSPLFSSLFFFPRSLASPSLPLLSNPLLFLFSSFLPLHHAPPPHQSKAPSIRLIHRLHIRKKDLPDYSPYISPLHNPHPSPFPPNQSFSSSLITVLAITTISLHPSPAFPVPSYTIQY